jgi:hypothetical protein
MYGRNELLEVLRRAKTLVSRAGNNFGWSGWNDAGDAIRQIDFKISLIETQPEPDPFVVADLFWPTGAMQELSIDSGWAHEFEDLAQQFESIAQRIRRDRNPHLVRRFDPRGGPIPLDKLGGLLHTRATHGTTQETWSSSRRIANKPRNGGHLSAG